jgi:hypothetical protein
VRENKKISNSVKPGPSEAHIQCYAQDPAYSKEDKAALESHGVIVLRDPEAWLEADESSAILAFSPDVPVRQVISDLTQPAMMIWTMAKGNYQDLVT